jgi:UDP-N-acetylmuramate dehydrogenase
MLSQLTTLGLGGPAERFVAATSDEELLAEVPGAALVLSGGSNLVVADEGVPGTTVQLRTSGVAVDGTRVTAAAGEDWDAVVALAVSSGLAGLEALSGIPGSVGATPVQNVGAYGADVAQVLASVRVLDRASGTVVSVGAADCDFGYRDSRFKREPGRWLVLSVTFELGQVSQSAPVRYAELARVLNVPLGGTAPLADVRAAVLQLRRGKGMVVDPADPDSRSAGSFFTNPVVSRSAFAALQERLGEVPSFEDVAGVKVPAAWLIEQAGFRRGHGAGRVGLSSKHVLALVNRGGGTTAELLDLAREVRAGVRERSGVTLVPEPVLVGVAL